MKPSWLVLCLAMPFGSVRASDEVDRTLDLRNASETSGNYYVIFCARRSKAEAEGVGHAYVVWAEENATRQLSAARAFGFYPGEGQGKKAVFGDVSGSLVNEATKRGGEKLSLITHRLTVRVNRDRWKESQKEIASWKTADYNLYKNNCTHFVHSVAFDLGLVVERPRTELPSHYLSRLIEASKRSD